MTTTTPNYMNIASSKIAGTCNSKCNYYFKYPTTNTCTATNYGTQISLSYDPSNTPPVLFNDIQYNISQITIFTPSLHQFNGKQVDAEIIIEHIPVTGSTSGNMLVVCIPIISQSNALTTSGNLNSTNILTNIINAVSTGAPSRGESTSHINAFSLNDLVPMKPFYSYQSTDFNIGVPLWWVVYGIENAIVLPNNIISTLQKIVPYHSPPIEGKYDLFVNNNGPSIKSPESGDEIYIDCRPTDASEDTQLVSTSLKPAVNNDVMMYLSNPYFVFILFAVVFAVILFVTSMFLSSMKGM